MGVTFVLGDPVGPTKDYAALIDEFLSAYPRTVFCQISKPTAVNKSKRQRAVKEIGCDMDLELPNYDLEGPQKAKLRQAAHKIEREGYRFEERLNSDSDFKELEALN